MKTRQNYALQRIVIDNTATFLNWAKQVQFDVAAWARPRCDYQDDYAHTAREVIDAAFNAATPDERRTILCAVYNTMSYDEVERLLLVRAKHARQIEFAAAYDEIDRVMDERGKKCAAREAAVAQREAALKDSMKSYHKRLNETRRQLQNARANVDRLRTMAQDYATRSIDDAEDARKFRKVRALLGVA